MSYRVTTTTGDGAAPPTTARATGAEAVADTSATVLAVSANDSDLGMDLGGERHADVRVLEVSGENTVITRFPNNLSTLVMSYDVLRRHFPVEKGGGRLLRAFGGFSTDIAATRALIIREFWHLLMHGEHLPTLDYRSDRRSFAGTALATLVLDDPRAHGVSLPVGDGPVTVIAHSPTLAAAWHTWESPTVSLLTATIPEIALERPTDFGISVDMPNLFALYLGVEGGHARGMAGQTIFTIEEEVSATAPDRERDPIYRFFTFSTVVEPVAPGVRELRAFATNAPLHEISWLPDMLPNLEYLFCLPGPSLSDPLPQGVRVVLHPRPEEALLDFCATSQYMSGVADLFVPLDFGNAFD